jgi:hypothetical protein
VRIGNWELPASEEILQWRVHGGFAGVWLNRNQAGQMLEQLGYEYETIGRALDVSSAPGQGWRYDIGNHRVRYDTQSGKYVITRWRQPSRFDPVPYLAALIDGLHDACTDQAEGAFWRRLGELMSGPYGALRGGLLLDEPGREDQSTEDAIREALKETSHR